MEIDKFLAKQGEKIKLAKFSTDVSDPDLNKKEAKKILQKKKEKLAELQDLLYAHDKYSLLIIFQAMDAAGKDSAIKHVMSGVNPQGTQVFSFKQPSAEELDHDFLWRVSKSLPERGRIGIFNRSHYEEVLVVRVHNLIKYQKIPQKLISDSIWEDRFTSIKNFENHVCKNGTVIIKFFLNVSKDEQRKRFIDRLEKPSKNWKFSASDLEERSFWDQYQNCYEDAIMATSTKNAPWYILPADTKWYTRLVISEILIHHMEKLDMKYPELDEKMKSNIELYKEQLRGDG